MQTFYTIVWAGGVSTTWSFEGRETREGSYAWWTAYEKKSGPITAELGLVPRAEHPITFEVDGPAQVIGPMSVIAEAGIAPVLLRAGTEPGTITVTARSKGLQEVGGKIASVPESAIGQYEVLCQSRSTRDDLAAFRDLRTASKSLEG